MHYLQAELYDRVQQDPAIFEFLQSGSLDGIWYWDIEHPDQEWLSPQFWRLFGYDPSEKRHLASEWQDLIFPEDLAVAIDNFQKHCADPNHPYDQIVRYRHRNGSTVWVRCRGIAIRDEHGRAVRMLGAHNDLTELMNSRQVLAAKSAELQRVNADLSAFSARIAHDLRAPLRTINGFTKVLADRAPHQLDTEGQDAVRRVQAAGLRIAGLVEAILELARAGQAQLSGREVDLTELARAITAELRERQPDRNVEVKVSAGMTVRGDPDLLRALLQNLLDNAWKFTRRREVAHIEVGTQSVDGETIYFVRDDGAGFDVTVATELFLPFQRQHRQDEFEGTGVGLATVRRIVERHGGRIWAESAVDRGTTLYFTLPAGGGDPASEIPGR